MTYTHWGAFLVGKWFTERCALNSRIPRPWEVAQRWISTRNQADTALGFPALWEDFEFFQRESTPADFIDLGGVQIDRNKYPSLQRNSAQIKGNG